MSNVPGPSEPPRPHGAKCRCWNRPYDPNCEGWKEMRAVALAQIAEAEEPNSEQMERLANAVEAFSKLQKMTPQELVHLALAHMPDMPYPYEQVVEELCTRVYPNWTREAGSTPSGEVNDPHKG